MNNSLKHKVRNRIQDKINKISEQSFFKKIQKSTLLYTIFKKL